MFAALHGPAGRESGSKSPLPLTLANHPELGTRFLNFSVRLLRASTISGRLRELLVLRVAWRLQCEYEWGHHVRIAQEEGVTPAEIERVKAADYAGFPVLERAALSAADQLAGHAQIDDATWAALTADLDSKQVLDLLFTIGSYTMLGWVLNATGLRIEPGNAGLDWSASGA
jgi:4-carboxymuconolactone decarboxylase